MKYEIQQMLNQGSGAIVNTSSVAGLIGYPGASPYIASKHAVMGLTRSIDLCCDRQNDCE
jgi:NAD(P)-dependent dehydrogenase (short-subunit alcohol dehydrogenase family)